MESNAVDVGSYFGGSLELVSLDGWGMSLNTLPDFTFDEMTRNGCVCAATQAS